MAEAKKKAEAREGARHNVIGIITALAFIWAVLYSVMYGDGVLFIVIFLLVLYYIFG